MLTHDYCRAASKAVSYIEKSSDEEDGTSRRRKEDDSDNYDDASDFLEDDNDESDGDDSLVVSSDDEQMILNNDETLARSAKKRCKPATMQNVKEKESITRKTKHIIVKKERHTTEAINNNPENRVRSIEMGRLHNETLFEFHKRCFVKYKELHGNLIVKQKFTVPWSDDWPEEMWDMKLGLLTYSIRCGKQHLTKKVELIDIGFNYERQAPPRYGWDKISLALRTFKELNGHILVPQKFIIPTATLIWHEILWGMKLGGVVSDIRFSNDHSAHRDEILAMGIKYISR